MKKWCMAAAVMCATGAWAQSSVTLSGIADAYVGSIRMAGDARKTVLGSGGMSTSYWGLSGTEDLGGGLTAGFKLGAFYRIDTGDAGRFNGDNFFARDANVSLSGGFGTLSLGRSSAPNFLPTVLFNPFGDSFAFSPLVLHSAVSAAGFPTTTNTADTGWSNQVVYSTPTFGGFRANLHYQFGEQSTSGLRDANNHGIDVWYGAGPLSLVAYYERAQIANPAGTSLIAGGDVRKSGMLGASYDFQWAKFFLTYGEAKRELSEERFKTVQLGVSAPIGAGRIAASVAQTKREMPLYASWAGWPVESGREATKRTTATVGYDYFLSKRTDLYANVMHDRATDVHSGTSFGVGVRHRF
ncbi:porin [Xenophilus sp. Marseille-Q4582]|uniref:porin n=1 Tax=Xenophilus sp. Marseille-Q4582 TaxID=2866600 RepID=UPI001CE48AFC|nr:porin [Xenophilus sp. Marseille-Q4582]